MAISPDTVVASNAIDPNAADSTATNPSDASVQRYYEVTLQPQQSTLVRGDRQCSLQLGMEAEARIVTQRETFLRFLLRKARLLSS